MNKGVSLAALAFVLLLASSSVAAAGSPRGFAAYTVSVVTPRGEHSLIINETVGPSSKTGFSDLILQFIGGTQNLTYSKVVNSSSIMFPFLPSVANQSLDYSNGTLYRIHLNIATAGTTSVLFRGSHYNLNVLKVWGTATFGNRTFGANGTLETFPSTLVYSAAVGNSTYRLQSVLLSTSLPLLGPSSQMATAAVVGVGIGLGGVALAGAFLLRRRERKADKQGEKPLHWVD